jgi:hypothetical protein
MVRLNGTNDNIKRCGLLYGVTTRGPKGKQVTVKNFETCYTEEQYLTLLRTALTEKINGKNIKTLQIVGWFWVQLVTDN